MTMPTADGFFGDYGGQFVPDSIRKALDELTRAFERYREDPEFWEEYRYYQKHFTGRPSPLYFCANLTRHCGGAKIYLKREVEIGRASCRERV